MKSKNSVFILFILVINSLSAQIKISKDTILSRDSIVKLNELSFKNDNEKEFFYKFVHNKDINDAFQLLFYASSSNINSDSLLQSVNQYVDIIKEKTKDLSEKKKIKFLYGYIHKNFFDKYVNLTLFPDIFSKKEFNCLSASILYAYFLEKLAISYEARLSNDHVYLVAYPKTLNIVMETTNPITNINNITDNFKKDYITQMRSLKMIGSQEFDNYTINELFSKYYFDEDVANFYDLIGSHYLNQAAGLIEKFNYSDAYSLALKSHLLNPSYKTIYAILMCGSNKIQQDAYLKYDDAEILGLFSRLNNYGITNEMIISDFNSISKTQLFDNNDTTLYTHTFNTLMKFMTDSSLKSSIGHSYYKAYCLYWYQSTKIDKALSNIDKAFNLNPNNKETEQLLVEIFSNYMDINKNNTSDYVKMYEKIESYIKIKPTLAENKLFGTFRVYYWIDLADNEYLKGNIIEGDKYLDKFEKLVTRELTTRLSYDIQNVYVNASFYFYKKYNNKKAKEYILRGLKILPDNYELKRRLNAL